MDLWFDFREPRWVLAYCCVVGIVFCCVLGLLHVVKAVKKHWQTIVERNSVYLKKVRALNERTEHHRDLGNNGCIWYTMTVNSKAKFDRASCQEALELYFSQYPKYVVWLLDSVSENRRIEREYTEQFNSLASAMTEAECKKLHMSYQRFLDIEKQLVMGEKLNIVKEISIVCCVEYTSPQGRNTYSKDDMFSESEIRTAWKDFCQKEDNKKTEEYRRKAERAKMSDSLRYDVLRHDNFQCRLCGRSKRDGVILEVDHIIPVSKGGTSVFENLQTLCRECNRGKGAKL